MLDRMKHMPLANAILRRPPGFYSAARRLLSRAEAMSRADIEAWQADRLTRVLAAARRLPGYAAASHGADLADWPILTKADMLGREADFAAASALPCAPAATGGTTGQPLKLMRTWRSIAFEQATIDHLCAARGVEPARARIAVLRGDSIKPAADMTPPFWIDEGPQRRIFSAHHLNRETAAHYKAALRYFQPGILFCYPSSLAALLALADEGCGLRIPLVFSSSEVLAPEILRRAREILSADVIDFYGHAERIACAASLNDEGWRFLPAYGHVELLPAGEGLARIVATSLSDRGQIFVRYETGDLARVSSHDPAVLREIALGLRAFGGVEGRDGEYIELADGRRIIGLNHIPRGVAGAASIQLYRSAAAEVTLFVTPIASQTFDAARLIANFREKFPASIAARLVTLERPARERNGKAPLLLRAPDPASIVPSPHPSHSMEQVA